MNNIQTVMIQTKIDDSVVFSLEANRSGSYSVLKKKSDGTVEQISAINENIFNELTNSIDPTLLQKNGSKYDFKDKSGKTCDLVVSFITSETDQKTFEFIYGLSSSQPPKEIIEIVKRAIVLTQSI